MPDGTDQLVDFFALLRILLLTGFPLYSEPSFGTMRTILSEAEKSKCLRFLLSTPFAVILHISSEFNQATLVLFQFQSKVTHPMPKSLIESLRFFLILKASNKVVSIYHDSAISPQRRLKSFPEPPYHDVVHIDVGNDWGTNRPLPTSQLRILVYIVSFAGCALYLAFLTRVKQALPS
jgi:hypothetical protein